MSKAREKLKKALENYQELIADLELDKSISVSRSQKFEGERRIEEYEAEIKRIEQKLQNSEIQESTSNIM